MPNIDPELLRSIPLFSLLDDQEIAVLAQNLDEKQFLAGQMIFREDDPGDAMYIVQSGKVELFLEEGANKRVTVAFAVDGELFGELSLLDNAPRSASARAVENTHALVVDRQDLHLLVNSKPHAALDMIAMLGKRLRETNTLLRDRVTRNVNEEMPLARTFGQRLSDFLTAVAGDIRFVYFNALWFLVWITFNLGLIPGLTPFDPFPFGLLTMIVSLEAIFLSLFVLISQNRQAAREKIRNDIEYEVNLRAEIEVRTVINQVEELQQLMLKHLSAMQAFETKRTTKPESGVKSAG